jgi:PKD repeat protein
VRITTTGPGGTESIFKTGCIEVNNIHVDFTATPTNGLYPLTVAFTSDMNANITQMTWDFGDGHHSQSSHPVHTYSEVGIYSVSLNVHAETKDILISRQDFIHVSGRTLSGQIKGAETNNPLANYTVELWQQNESLIAHTISDQNGNYTFTGLKAANDYKVSVWSSEYMTEFY